MRRMTAISLLLPAKLALAVSFNAPQSYTVSGTGHPVIAAADFNGDGKLDLAVAYSGSNAVSILLGTGTGTFLPQVNYAVQKTPLSLAVGDFNGDGKPDLAVANSGSNNIIHSAEQWRRHVSDGRQLRRSPQSGFRGGGRFQWGGAARPGSGEPGLELHLNFARQW